MELSKTQKAYRELLEAVCTKRDELLKRNAGVQETVDAMRTQLAELEARGNETTDLNEALKLSDQCAVIRQRIESAKKVKGVDVPQELKAFAHSKENQAIYVAAADEHQAYLEQFNEDRRRLEAEIEARRKALSDHPYVQTHYAIDNIINCGGWRTAGWNGGLSEE